MCGLSALLVSMVQLAAQTAPLDGTLEEVEEVHRVQVDVSVIDPRGDNWASVPGLAREAFEIRLDGVRVPPELAERIEFDEVCAARPADSGELRDLPLASTESTLIVLVDLNFLDIRMRHAVAEGLDELATMAARQRLRVKVLAFVRRLVSLTSGFTSDADQIRGSGRELLQVIAGGPPRGRPTGLDENFSADDLTSSETLEERFGGGTPPDIHQPEPAFSLDAFSSRQEGPAAFQRVPGTVSPLRRLAELSEIDPRPSLAALESVMLSHAAIPGRKAVVLFSSEWFDLPEELWLTYLQAPLQAAQGGFTLWAVDAGGLARVGGSRSGSRLLGQLASATGGETLRSAGRLAIAFERALSQLSCYYLFSIPVEPPDKGSRRHTVDVRLDTGSHPEYWRYHVRAASGVTLLSRSRVRERRRLAALMEPDAYAYPEIRISAAYPVDGDRWHIPIEVSVLLSDLLFQRVAEGELEATIAWEGLVTDERGRTVCRLGEGRVHRVRSKTPPTRHPPSMLMLRTGCDLKRPGVYDVRAFVEDFASGDVGAGTAIIDVPEPRAGLARVSALRLGRNSGRDFLLEVPSGADGSVSRDVARRVFVPVFPGEGIAPEERLITRFVTCGTPEPPRVVLYRAAGGPNADDPFASWSPSSLFQVLVSVRGTRSSEQISCREFEGIIPENTLTPGSYGLALIERDEPVKSKESLDLLLAERRVLALSEFRVFSPPPPPEPPPLPDRTAGLGWPDTPGRQPVRLPQLRD
ncbi:MAG: hypothetical protein JSV80_09705 [Acidobacteriota bacterium]|nr:MAG: hypothetical protein JSV80_09705 [Acidobacteriota bacterium]